MNKELQLAFYRKIGKFIRSKLDVIEKKIECQSVSIDYDGERTFTVTTGDNKKSFVLPVMIDRGVYDNEKSYQKGDCVSHGGSLWVSQKDAPDHGPSDGDGWRLAVKRGKDA